MLRLMLLLCVVFISSVNAAPQHPASPQTLTDKQRQLNLESFDYVWKKVRDQYWDPDLGGVDWEAARVELRQKLESATTDEAARGVMGELLNRMNVSHFGIIPAEAYQQLGQEKPPGEHVTGMDVRIIDNHIVVTDIVADSPADKLGIRRGWQLLKIGDEEVDAKLADLSERLKDNPHRRAILVSAAKLRLRGKPGQTIDVVFRDGNDAEKDLSIPLAPERGKPSRFGHIPEFHVWIDVEKLAGNIGYIRFNAFMDPPYVMRRFNQAMTDFMETKGIIIDVRGNGGGLGGMASAMMGWLVDEKRQTGTLVMRDAELKMLVHPRPNPYVGPVVVLIDEYSVSAAEFFASGMQDLQLAHLVGARTAGAVLGSSIERLPNGDGFQYARANYFSMTTGQSLEGVGVTPHLTVQHTREALLQGRDLQLEAAVDWVEQQIRQSH